MDSKWRRCGYRTGFRKAGPDFLSASAFMLAGLMEFEDRAKDAAAVDWSSAGR